MTTGISDYLLIGDLHTAALVSNRGSIDWLCLPYFDSPSIFGALLDSQKGGSFSIAADGYETASRYIPNTAIAETTFSKERSIFTVQDFMLPRPTEEVVAHYLIRRVQGVKGQSSVTFVLDPRPRYARQTILFKRRDDRLYVGRLGERSLWINVPRGSQVHRRNGGTSLEIVVPIEEGEVKDIVLEYAFESRVRLQGRDFESETVLFWREWVGKGKFFNVCRNELIRSAITLKLMQFYPTGGIIAAPTTSLPEAIGGERNWDYRYVWLRDASFTLYAFYVLGFKDEAKKFFRFIEEVAHDFLACEDESCDIDIAVMFTIWGQKIQREETLQHLRGYRNSKPVRIGNGASSQRQLDIYGSLIDAYYVTSTIGVPISKRGRDVVLLLARKIATQWQEPDSGIWEVRGFTEQFTYGRLMAWVGMDRAIKLADELKISPKQKREWQKLKVSIERWLWKNCFDKKTGTFTQYPGVRHQDATNFLFPLLEFLPKDDARSHSIIERTRKELTENELFVYRYHAKDGVRGEEGAFTLCTFWMIAVLAATGKHAEALKLFRQFEQLLPEHGLMAEQMSPETHEQLGNYPQAFSHIGFIVAAYHLHRNAEKTLRLRRKKRRPRHKK